MTTLETVLLVLQLVIAGALIFVILFQRTAQDGGGLVGGGSTMGGLFTARGSANLLTRTTAILATAFILNSLGLGYITSSQHQNRSILDQIQTPTKTNVPAPSPAVDLTGPTPAVPLVPTGQPAVTSPAVGAPVMPFDAGSSPQPTPNAVPTMPVPLAPEAPNVPTGEVEPEPAGK